MCGIIGYTGIAQAKKIIIDGLYALEYRGYDSSGIAVQSSSGEIKTERSSGRVADLERLIERSDLSGCTGIGHTRWATHGSPTAANAHPHSSDSLVLVHNGIIDNYDEIKKMLASDGYSFASETDTEVVAHLIDREYKKTKSPAHAIFEAEKYLVGSYALGIMFRDRPGEIWAVRKDSPLIVAFSNDEAFIASDIPAVLKHSRDIFRPEENTIVCLSQSGGEVFYPDGEVQEITTEHIDWDAAGADKEGYDHFMLKEIFEEPDAIRRCVAHRLNENGLPDFSGDGINEEFWKSFDSISLISCGSATHAGFVGRYLTEKLAGVPVTVNTASEYRYDPPASVGHTLAIAISQSGETADTLAGIRLAKQLGLKTAAIINVFGSAIAREADYVMYTNAGPEIAVATTKGYTTQLAVLTLIAIKLALVHGKISDDEAKELCRALVGDVPRAVAEILSDRAKIKALAEKIHTHNDVYFIGRGQDCHAAVECSLKLKEISYIHSEAYPAGELKHGTLSLIERGTPVIAIATAPELYGKMCGNIREVMSRGGHMILLCADSFGNPDEFSNEYFDLPNVPPLLTPFLSVVACQLLAYEVALLRGCDVDHPRNLAKSVTVE